LRGIVETKLDFAISQICLKRAAERTRRLTRDQGTRDCHCVLSISLTAYYRLSTKGGTEITRAIDNRPMSSRSQALFRSITEVKHVLRQHYLQFNQHTRRSFTLFSGL